MLYQVLLETYQWLKDYRKKVNMLKKRKARNKQLSRENEVLQQKVSDWEVKYNKLEEAFVNYKNKVNNHKR